MDSEVIRNMVNNILAGNNAEAQDNFNTAMAEKLTASLDDKKQEIAASLGKKETDEEIQ